MHTFPQLKSGQLSGSKTLKLSCGLTQLPTEILELADTLEVLDLSGNLLTSLPNWFPELKNLKIAFFSNNEFTEFPAVLGQCPKLEMIGFKSCKIKEVAEGAIPKTTRWLILTDNQIPQLPASIGTCQRMQKLMLAGNKLKGLPPEMAALQHLELLRISANELQHLPDWLAQLPRLAWLAFAGNPCLASNHSPQILPEIQWDELELAELLGEGASGVISKANWQRKGLFNQQVAVKVFKGNLTSDGLPQDEMQACLAAGNHPHLVQALGKISGHPAQKQGLVLGLIPEGYRNLGNPPNYETCTRDTFAPGTIFSLPEVIKISAGIASAAAHLHDRGILHGDLYAHNTLVHQNGHALFGDFGAATLYGGSGFGLPLEQIEVRAFGCLLEDLLTHLSPQAAAHPTAHALHQLKDDCLQPIISQRPDFATISSLLENLFF